MWMMLARRQFLTGLIAAPAVVAIGSLMPLRGTRLIIPAFKPHVLLNTIVEGKPTTITYHLDTSATDFAVHMVGAKDEILKIIDANIVFEDEAIAVHVGGVRISVERPMYLRPGDTMRILLRGV
jgi:hypothetical protein